MDDYDEFWSPYSICGTLADKRGYTLQRGNLFLLFFYHLYSLVGGGAPDFHRAGLEIIHDVADGIILLSFPPPELKQFEELVNKTVD